MKKVKQLKHFNNYSTKVNNVAEANVFMLRRDIEVIEVFPMIDQESGKLLVVVLFEISRLKVII